MPLQCADMNKGLQFTCLAAGWIDESLEAARVQNWAFSRSNQVESSLEPHLCNSKLNTLPLFSFALQSLASFGHRARDRKPWMIFLGNSSKFIKGNPHFEWSDAQAKPRTVVLQQASNFVQFAAYTICLCVCRT